MKPLEPIPFDKWNGAGNDFIILDNRDGRFSEEDIRTLAVKLCSRPMSLGADGLILLENSIRGHLKLRFFNPDGSEFNMCMNGSRCAARHAFMHVIAPRRMTLETRSGILHASVEEGSVRLSFYRRYEIRPDMRLAYSGRKIPAHFVKVGDPHVVIPVKDVTRLDVGTVGRTLRSAPELGPEGANVNFVKVRDDRIDIRTYERGVESETYGCGSGCVSTALVLAYFGRKIPEYRFRTRSGVELLVRLDWEENDLARIELRGDARRIAWGNLAPDAWTWG